MGWQRPFSLLSMVKFNLDVKEILNKYEWVSFVYLFSVIIGIYMIGNSLKDYFSIVIVFAAGVFYGYLRKRKGEPKWI